jgi:hypothetical protein
MSKALYILKMSLLLHQLPLHWTKKRKITKMSLFVVFSYMKYWFSSTSLTSAACNDLDLYRSLLKFKSIDMAASTKACEVINRHTWYLTEELVPLSLFNDNISLDERTLLARKILLQHIPAEKVTIQKPTLPLIKKESKLVDFVGGRSRVLFDLLKVPLDFLGDEDWHLHPDYTTVKDGLRNLSPINDSSERALALATKFNGQNSTRTEASQQELVQVVEDHTKNFTLQRKSDLKKIY